MENKLLNALGSKYLSQKLENWNIEYTSNNVVEEAKAKKLYNRTIKLPDAARSTQISTKSFWMQ